MPVGSYGVILLRPFKRSPGWLFLFPGAKATITLLLASAGLSVAGFSILRLTDGVSSVDPGILLFPVVLIAFYFGPAPGTMAGLGLAAGAWLSYDDTSSIIGGLSLCLSRATVFTALGFFIGLIGAREHSTQAALFARRQHALDVTPGLIQRERENTLAQIARGVVHDLNNAISPIIGFSDLILINNLVRTDPDRAEGYVQTIHSSATQAGAITRRLRAIYENERPDEHRAVFDVSKTMDSALLLTEARWRTAGAGGAPRISVDVRTDRNLLIEANEWEVRSALTNLIFNAVDAMPDGGTITLEGHHHGSSVEVSVADTGTGMDEEAMRKWAEPFFTTKPHGSGLGLPISKSM
ncbi:MAG: HAMP domain-containing sensor histidine kinase, partial [Dehalococcoidia bacterium]